MCRSLDYKRQTLHIMLRKFLCVLVLAAALDLPCRASGPESGDSGNGPANPAVPAQGAAAATEAPGEWMSRIGAWTEEGATMTADTVTGDTMVLFHFVPGRLMFYSPFKDNEANIRAVARLIERQREAIEAGHAVLRVRGFCDSFGSQAENLRAAKNRSNQVKSWFITHHGMKEDYYRTTNSTTAFRGERNVVAVVGLEWLPGHEPKRDTVRPVEAVDTVAVDTVPAVVEEPEPAVIPADTVKPEPEPAVERVRVPLAVKTNLLYDALLLPTVEAEYLFNEKWSLNVEGSVAWWRIDGGVDKYYDLWIVSPEVRYWFKTKERWHGHHGGFFVGAGAYDLENGGEGYKGEYFMTGLAYGFMFPVKGCRSLHMEANVGVGYMYTEHEDYLPIDGHYVYQETGRTNYFGPLKAKFSLVWVLDLWKKKGGRR